jgi:hypothetical protein
MLVTGNNPFAGPVDFNDFSYQQMIQSLERIEPALTIGQVHPYLRMKDLSLSGN